MPQGSEAMDEELSGLLRLDRSHIGPAAETLIRAFRGYPLLRSSFADEAQRERAASHFFRFSLCYGIRYGETYATSPNLEGVAVWIPSDSYPMTAWRVVRSVPPSALFGFGRSGAARLRHVGDHIDAVHKRLAPFRHWFLLTIGVEPAYQGRGYAATLMRPMLARTDREGLPCYLETFDAGNVTLYEHFGFEVVDEAPIPKTTLTNWAMLRKAQEPA